MASELETLGEDHVKATRALGFSERAIFGRFALKPALVPVVSVIALVFAYSLVNAFLVEAIFDWPGLGSYAADSISSLDTPAIIGITLFIAIVYVVANLVVDLVQAWHRSEDHAHMSNGADVLTTVDTESVFGAIRRGLRENRLLATGLLMALSIVVVALLAPVLAPSAPDATHPFQTLLAPSSAHWFGTDQLGRDLYSRVLFGTRISPVIAFLVLAISCRGRVSPSGSSRGTTAAWWTR